MVVAAEVVIVVVIVICATVKAASKYRKVVQQNLPEHKLHMYSFYVVSVVDSFYFVFILEQQGKLCKSNIYTRRMR